MAFLLARLQRDLWGIVDGQAWWVEAAPPRNGPEFRERPSSVERRVDQEEVGPCNVCPSMGPSPSRVDLWVGPRFSC